MTYKIKTKKLKEKKVTTLSKAFHILGKNGYEIGITGEMPPYRITKFGQDKFMNRAEVIFYVNYEMKQDKTNLY